MYWQTLRYQNWRMRMRNESHSGPEVERLCPRDGGGREETKRKRERGSFLSCSFLIIGVACLTLLVHDVNLWIKYTQLQATARAVQPQLLFPSLAQSTAFREENRFFSLAVADSPFAGDPSPELDHAWHNLLEGSAIRVTKEDLDFYNITSLPLQDGAGFASELFVSHELHCLVSLSLLSACLELFLSHIMVQKKVRQWVYKETYFAGVEGLERGELKRHIDHCIETIRQGIMCRGDVSLATYTYLGDTENVTARSWAPHQCVDFAGLMNWARSHAVDLFHKGALASPEGLGPEHFTTQNQPH
ncbi:hypothetical protein AAL_07849 [Moelleriella libera RCEF 2490]|uniref:Tat pathway signal sequence n=1 Tax=Moelleriella libera RCEF 2490 TaxID=1081109 RepID=A0A167WS44_9HYPO|nr:hypothetical protein AAL_07849 [Moelleriella libera RCEF 2490]